MSGVDRSRMEQLGDKTLCVATNCGLRVVETYNVTNR
jgi:hypothetical protein